MDKFFQNKNNNLESFNNMSNVPIEYLKFIRFFFVLDIIDITESDYIVLNIFSNKQQDFFDSILSFRNNIAKKNVSVKTSLKNILFDESFTELLVFLKSIINSYSNESNVEKKMPGIKASTKYFNNYENSKFLQSNSFDEDLDSQFNRLFNPITDDIAQKDIIISNQSNDLYIKYIDNLLKRSSPKFDTIPHDDFFDNVNIIDLLKVYILLESDFISIIEYNDGSYLGKFEYLDFQNTNPTESFANLIFNYYKSKKNSKSISIDFNDLNSIFFEKDDSLRVYKIAAYYKYLIEYKKIDIIIKLRELLHKDFEYKGIPVREHYFIYKYSNIINNLPYSDNTKNNIFKITNYILNYYYKENIPLIPINLLLYTDDKETVEQISEIIGEFMWFFGYLPSDMNYYQISQFSKFEIAEIYNKSQKNGGIIIINKINQLQNEDISYINETLDKLDYFIRKSNNTCSILYGEKKYLTNILNQNIKSVFNVELDFDYLDINKIFELCIKKLEQITNIPDSCKDKIFKYINSTYIQSDIKNYEYINNLFNEIILNMNNRFTMEQNNELILEDIPDIYNTENIPEILKSLNNLVGLEEIKEQINDLISLLKFYKKADIDIKNFNLHMIFKGNPGTGKTTVARLLTKIFYQLGYIQKNKLTELSSKDLIAEYVGQTARKNI